MLTKLTGCSFCRCWPGSPMQSPGSETRPKPCVCTTTGPAQTPPLWTCGVQVVFVHMFTCAYTHIALCMAMCTGTLCVLPRTLATFLKESTAHVCNCWRDELFSGCWKPQPPERHHWFLGTGPQQVMQHCCLDQGLGVVLSPCHTVASTLMPQ